MISLAGMFALARAGSYQRWIALYAAAVASIVLCSYLFYMPFESWTYVRFLLPMYPFMFVSLLGVAAIAPLRNRANGENHRPACSHAGHCRKPSATYPARESPQHEELEHRYFVVAQYARNAFPGNAVFLAMQHSGSIRYHGERKTLRYDWIPSQSLDEAVAQLNGLGFKPYFLLEDFEEPQFQSRFGAFSRLGKLDWPPNVVLRPERVRIWDPAER